MKKDLTLNIILKAVGFSFSSVLIYGLFWSSEDLISLNLIISFFFLLRTLDFSLTYLRRLINSDHKDTNCISNITIYFLQTLVIITFCKYFEVDLLNTMLLVVCCVTYCELAVLGNRNQATYIFNCVHPICGILSFLLLRLGFEVSIETSYLFLSCSVQIFLMFWLKRKEVQTYDIETIGAVYSGKHLFQFFAVILFVCHSELSQILTYNIGTLDDYAFLSVVKRGEAILFGLISILTNIIWNKYGGTLTRFDEMTVNKKVYFSFYGVAVGLYFGFNSFQELNFVYLIIIMTVMSNIWYFFYSQIFLRLGKSLFTLKVGLFETVVSLSTLIIFGDLEIYFVAVFIVSGLKIIFSNGVQIENTFK